MGFGLRTWFIEQSGLDESQVINGNISSFVYEAQAVTLPVHPGVKPDLLAKADYGFRHFSPAGFTLDRSVPELTERFAALYNGNGIVTCNSIPAEDYALMVTMFGPVLAWSALGWPDMRDINPSDETWRLGVEAMREMQQLSIFGTAGKECSKKVSAEETLRSFQKVEEASLTLDHTAFFRYHHGGKLGGQQRKSMQDALALGKAEGREMRALQTLAAQIPD